MCDFGPRMDGLRSDRLPLIFDDRRLIKSQDIQVFQAIRCISN